MKVGDEISNQDKDIMAIVKEKGGSFFLQKIWSRVPGGWYKKEQVEKGWQRDVF